MNDEKDAKEYRYSGKPDTYHGTLREWRRDKREDCDVAIRAVQDLNAGSAFTPAYHQIRLALEALHLARKLMSSSSWDGRKR